MPRKSRRQVREWVYISLPIVVLVADLAVFPLFESSSGAGPVNVARLVRVRHQHAGRIRLHEIETTLDALDRPAFAAAVDHATSAILVPCFLSEPGVLPGFGALGQYVQERLSSVSPEDARRLSAILDDDRIRKGAILDLPLRIPPPRRAGFPFDHLFIIVLAEANEYGTGDEGVFGASVPQLMQLAESKRITTLVVPAVGYNWQNKHSIAFDSLYWPLLNNLPHGGAPRRIILDLYSRWPTFAIESAVRAMNRAVDDVLASNPLTRIYRQELRLLLLFVAASLFATTRYVTLTAKGSILVGTAYLGLCTAVGNAVDAVVPSLDGIAHTIVQVIIYAAIACTFPVIVRWKPDQIFSARLDR